MEQTDETNSGSEEDTRLKLQLQAVMENLHIK